ncbi:tRNA pseudouridine(55) synthase TruB [Alloacidobacterium dinghuense]|uniref:tRNA pseudouridine synthase B n=1 Tax=Alloacidobacterium dinghuense TaxID=2763107 RepID=A0A7G8BLG5_9BACT|nr:tRNA pseudouridine(55) synthase TruB [Alloacidobacterium dinghuense]QNI33385.1 tRNA pseudouridine(55) synthase TruB [Alloacidobacterium dinghuense]
MNGLLIVDKPGGMTSHDVVVRVRRATGESSIGHLGTLDPMATGVLPLLLGKYTRLAQFFGSLEKTYTGTIRFGFATDTYDAEGQTVGDIAAVSLTLEQVREAGMRFQGEIEQMPPPFSAKKTDGKRAYQLARAGETPKLKAARITIKAFEITVLDGDTAAFRMTVSAGGYVRSVAHEMGIALGCGAHLASLRRVAAGPFVIDDALPLVEIEAHTGTLLEAKMPHPRALLPDLPAVTADALSIGRVRNGAAVNLPEFGSAPMVKVFEGQRNLIAIGRRIAGTLFQPFVVLI